MVDNSSSGVVFSIPLLLILHRILDYTFEKYHTYCVVGLSHKNADLSTRGNFSLDKEQTERLLARAKMDGLEELMVISTCNRTELMGIVEDPKILIDYLCAFSGGDVSFFRKRLCVK